MRARRIALLLAGLALTASVGLIVGGCDFLSGPDDFDPPALRVEVSVTPDTVRPGQSVAVRSVVRHYRGSGTEYGLGVQLCTGYWSEELEWPCRGCASLSLPYLGGGRTDTVQVTCELTDWPAPDSVTVRATLSWAYGTDSPDKCDGNAAKAGRPDSYRCFNLLFASDVLTVVGWVP